jgi:hypothetical protein
MRQAKCQTVTNCVKEIMLPSRSPFKHIVRCVAYELGVSKSSPRRTTVYLFAYVFRHLTMS